MNVDEVVIYASSFSDGLFDTADTAYCVPWKKFRGFEFAASGSTTALSLLFDNLRASASTAATTIPDKITLLIAANKQKEVCKDILAAVWQAARSGEGFVTIGDPSQDGSASISIASNSREATCSEHIARVTITYDTPDAG
tara:strand:- start:725 stop:1147 length:423 start_codon:yes stop_codon:yes gene_type:complete